jgi:hypothetical protein
VPSFTQAHFASGGVDIGLGGHEFGVTFSDMALDLAEVTQRLAKTLSLTCIAVHHLDAAASQSDAHRRKGQAFEFQITHHGTKRTALSPHQIGCWQPDIIKDQLGSW